MKLRSTQWVALEVARRGDMEGVRTWVLVDGAGCGARSTALSLVEIPPGKSHLLHRHPSAEQVVYVLYGETMHLTPEGRVPLRRGEAVYIPAGEWHGTHNESDDTVRLLALWGGVSSGAAAGYEPYDGRADDRTTFPDKQAADAAGGCGGSEA